MIMMYLVAISFSQNFLWFETEQIDVFLFEIKDTNNFLRLIPKIPMVLKFENQTYQPNPKKTLKWTH